LATEVKLTLPAVKDATGNPLGECITFADMSYVWGSVVEADIQLASEKATSVPIQLVDPVDFPKVPEACGVSGPADNTVAALGARGILGLGLFRQDCGASCVSTMGSSVIPEIYFSCPNASATTSCTSAAAALGSQLQNPVRLFPEDNNGIIVALPAVPEQGAASLSGSLIFGIGTRDNNALGSAAVYTVDNLGLFSTTFNGVTYSGANGSYIDSGLNMLLIPPPSATSLPVCTDAKPFYCPSTTQSYTATNQGHNGVTGQVSFSVANADSLFNTANAAFDNLAGDISGGLAWGLPFFFGRQVFVAIEGQSTIGGPGPYWAY
jgi:hypothetical protein